MAIRIEFSRSLGGGIKGRSGKRDVTEFDIVDVLSLSR
jgi:hypothetical protein